MTKQNHVSVIIPTFNRNTLLEAALERFTCQTLPNNQYDIIVIDDGSDDDTYKIPEKNYPFELAYYRQDNRGDAAARNLGVSKSESELLVFIDDDILVSPKYLEELAVTLREYPKLIVSGTIYPWKECQKHLLYDRILENNPSGSGLHEISFTELRSNNMAIRREDYQAIGPMDGLGFSGSSIWCDVDFAYRAHKLGFRFIRNNHAICCDRDFAIQDRDDRFQRGKASAYRAVVLFQKDPDIQPHIPMFRDMTPIDWLDDGIGLIFRKLARHPASSFPVLKLMEWTLKAVNQQYPQTILSRSLHRWIHGAYVFQGYRSGLKDLKSGKLKHKPWSWQEK